MMPRYPRAMRTALLAIIALVALKGLVWWLEPRMAFFPWRGIQRTPQSVGLQFSEHRITTTDGETLHAWWLEHPAPRAQVVYWHGNGGNLSLWLDVIADLHRHGFSVLAVDYRGYGASSGRPSEKGIYRDADATIRYFAERLRKDVATIVWGRSLGSVVAAYAASKSPPDALVLESAFPDARSLFAGNPLLLALSFLSTYRFPTSRHLTVYRGPLLVIHGDADRLIPFAGGRKVYDAAPGDRKTFLALRGADHNEMYSTATGLLAGDRRFHREEFRLPAHTRVITSAAPSTGSTRAARRAGRYDAPAAPARSATATTANVNGSAALTPNRSAATSRVAASDRMKPHARPEAVINAPLDRTRRMMSDLVAPRALTHAQFMQPLAHRLRHDSIEPDDGQKDRGSSEHRHEPQREAP